MANDIIITFFGTRGSTPVCAKEYMKYGGNTTCIAVETKQGLSILDCGTGMQHLQQEYFEKRGYRRADIFISHIHWDHVQGIPFFSPFFDRNCSFRIYGELRKTMCLQEQIEGILKSPMFPVKADALLADMEYMDFKCTDSIETCSGIVDTIRTEHPNTCTGYRFSFGDKRICFLIDCEMTNAACEELAADADILIMDAQYTQEEYPAKIGWGHSTYVSCCEFARKCGVQRLVLTHHDPFRKDIELDSMQKAAAMLLPGAVFASDGMRIEL